VTPRAAPLAPDLRRDALIQATLPLLLQHGRAVTTRQIATAAGVAEGTIFGVFESKDDLILSAVERGLDIEPFLADLQAIDRNQGLRERLLDLTERLQARFQGIFALMTAMGMVGPPRSHVHMAEGRQWAEAIMITLVEPDAASLTVPPEELIHMLRLLTFSGTHPHVSDGRQLTPDQIVGVILDGVLKKED
jgi:AcrR family transcriptional regulator